MKGVVNQEAQQEIQFPEVLHCVFCGAKGLFMDCLIKNTSAHIVVSKKCFLKIICATAVFSDIVSMLLYCNPY